MGGERIVILSMWQNDSATVYERAVHLLKKTHDGYLRWVWVVGDSSDDTEEKLNHVRAEYWGKDIILIRHDTGIAGDDPKTRLLRASQTANAGLDAVRGDDQYVLWHESDLRSPEDVVTRFLATGKGPVAGWVTLGENGIFYDTFAYTRDGRRFRNQAPYHDCYWPDRIFEVDSFGSCWMGYAADIRDGVRCQGMGVLDLCAGFKARGRRLWVDPRIPIVQPVELWISRAHA